MGFKYLWISAPELFKAEQLFVADDNKGLEMGASARRGSWSGVPWSYHHFVLEFSLISVVSACWGNERKKEKIQSKRWDLRENERKKKKNVVKPKEKKHLPPKTKNFLPYCGVAVERRTKFLKKVPLHNNFWKIMLSSRGYLIKKESHCTPWKAYFNFLCKKTSLYPTIIGITVCPKGIR